MCPEFSYSKGRIPATVKDNKGLLKDFLKKVLDREKNKA